MLEDADADTDEHEPNTATPSQHDASETEAEAAGHRNKQKSHDEYGSKKAASINQTSEAGNSVFYYDTSRGSPNMQSEKGKASITRISPDRTTGSESSDSDTEIILFQGRLNTTRKESDTIDMQKICTEIYAVGRDMEDTALSTEEQKPHENTAKQKTTRGKRGGRQAKARRAAVHHSEEVGDGILVDYIANMRENDEMHELLGTATALADTDNGSESSSDPRDDKNAEELAVEVLLATQSNKQPLSWAAGEHVMEHSDFDPMDWERPSIRIKQGKGAKQKLDLKFADIDSETERRLQTAWQNDRLIKAERKKGREQLRALKLTGGNVENGGANNMHMKYPKGMSVEQVAVELKTFITSFDHSICLPPMDKHARKMIHELASKFNVKSKSIGKADQRRPTLYRTKRTLRFDDEAFESAVRRIHRRYFPRLDYKGKSSQGQSSRNGYAEASYRDGEIVGASAPELSTENRGRAMLEKMGWSTGTALGSEENKGILLPVTQTVKRSKAGLG